MQSFTLKKQTDGKLSPNSRRSLQLFIESMKPETTYWCEGKEKNRRSNMQNAYLHVMFKLIQKGFYDLGYREIKTPDDAKYVMKDMFLSHYVENGTGGKIKMVKRTRDLTKTEMATFIDECIQFSAENLSVVIPPPETQTMIEFNHAA